MFVEQFAVASWLEDYHLRGDHHSSVPVQMFLGFLLPAERFVHHDSEASFYLRLREPHCYHCTYVT